MANGILLDSSVIVDHLRGKYKITSKVPPDELLFMSLTVLGELYKGVLKSANPTKSQAQLDSLLGKIAVLHPDTATAFQYAKIAAQLEKNGTPIPENDIWIAAVAIECSMPLATRDAHFQHVTGLQLLRW